MRTTYITCQDQLLPRHHHSKQKEEHLKTKGLLLATFAWEKDVNPDPAIKGLNSDFITPYVIASQRLSNRLIEEYDIMKQFKELSFI